MASKPAPAIRRQFDKEQDEQWETVEKVGSDTEYHRGIGEIGSAVYEVHSGGDDTGCPSCGHDEMLRCHDIGPEHLHVEYYCLNFKCDHFVMDALEYEHNNIRAGRPKVWDNTCICPECDARHTKTFRIEYGRDAENFDYHSGDAESGGIIRRLCDECAPTLSGGEA